MDQINLAEEIAQISWFHSIDFGNGIVSSGIKPLGTIRREADIIFKYDITGKSVIDVGAWNGA